MPHPTRQAPACVNCKHVDLHPVTLSRSRCDHPEAPVNPVNGRPELCKFGRGTERHGGWCGPTGRLFTPADSDGSSVQGVGDGLGGCTDGTGLNVGGQ